MRVRSCSSRSANVGVIFFSCDNTLKDDSANVSSENKTTRLIMQRAFVSGCEARRFAGRTQDTISGFFLALYSHAHLATERQCLDVKPDISRVELRLQR